MAGENFDRHEPVQDCVLRLEHNPHPSAANHPFDVVMAELPEQSGPARRAQEVQRHLVVAWLVMRFMLRRCRRGLNRSAGVNGDDVVRRAEERTGVVPPLFRSRHLLEVRPAVLAMLQVARKVFGLRSGKAVHQGQLQLPVVAKLKSGDHFSSPSISAIRSAVL